MQARCHFRQPNNSMEALTIFSKINKITAQKENTFLLINDTVKSVHCTMTLTYIQQGQAGQDVD